MSGSPLNESCHVCMSRVTKQEVMAHTGDVWCCTRQVCATLEFPHEWCVTHAYESHKDDLSLVTQRWFSTRQICATGWQRLIGCLIFTGRFPQQSPIISGSFAENDLQRLRKVTYEIRHPMGLRHPVHKCHMSEWKSYTNESRKRESLFIITRIIYEYGVLYSCDDTRGKYALHFNCHMNTLYRVWMSHVTYRYAVSHMNTSYYI